MMNTMNDNGNMYLKEYTNMMSTSNMMNICSNINKNTMSINNQQQYNDHQ
jgi:hypothetical protein